MSQQPVPGTHPAFAKTGAGRSVVPYLALHPMGFSVPPRLRLERWALTPPFHPCPCLLRNSGGLSFCGTVRRQASRPGRPRVSHFRLLTSAATGYAASRPVVFGLSSPGSRRKRSSALPKSKNSLQPIGLRTESKSGIGGIRENLAPDFIVLDGSVGNKIPSEIRHEVHNPGTNACSHTMVFVPELLKRKRTYC